MNGAAATTPAGPDASVLDDPLEQRRFTRWIVGSDGMRLAESTLRLSGMYCAACAGTIEHALAGLPTAAWTEPTGAPAPVGRADARAATEPAMDDFAARVAAAAVGPGTRSARVNCLNLLATMGQRPALRAGVDRLRAEGLQSPGLDFLDAECCLMEGEPERALELGLRVDAPELWSDQASHRLVQLGRAAVAAGRPERVLPRLRAWTERFPDAPGAGVVWLHRCLAALQDGARDEATTAFRRMRALLGERPDLAPLARVLGEADMEA